MDQLGEDQHLARADEPERVEPPVEELESTLKTGESSPPELPATAVAPSIDTVESAPTHRREPDRPSAAGEFDTPLSVGAMDEPDVLASPVRWSLTARRTLVYDAGTFEPFDADTLAVSDSETLSSTTIVPSSDLDGCCAVCPEDFGGCDDDDPFVLLDAPAMPPVKKKEPCRPRKTMELRFIYIILDEKVFPVTNDPDKVSQHFPSAPTAGPGESVDMSGPTVLPSENPGLDTLMMWFKLVIKKKRKCEDGSEVEDQHTIYFIMLFIWLPKDKRGRFAKALLDLLKKGGGPDPNWKNNAFAYVGHDDGSNAIPWKDVAETGRFSGNMDSDGRADPNGEHWDTRMADLSCFGETQGRESQDYAYHTDSSIDDAEPTFMVPEAELLGGISSGDVRGAVKKWNSSKPKVVVHKGNRLPSARMEPPKNTKPLSK